MGNLSLMQVVLVVALFAVAIVLWLVFRNK
jgi:hypothetical protein